MCFPQADLAWSERRNTTSGHWGHVRHGHPESSLGMFNPLILNLNFKIKKKDFTRIADILPRLCSFQSMSYLFTCDSFLKGLILDMDASPSLGAPLQNSPESGFSCSSSLPHSHSLLAIWRKTQLKCAPPLQAHHKAWCSSSICLVSKGAACELTFASIDFCKQCDLFIHLFLNNGGRGGKEQ